jgi:hypothetical protein
MVMWSDFYKLFWYCCPPDNLIPKKVKKVPEEPDFNDEDIRILDRVWAKIIEEKKMSQLEKASLINLARIAGHMVALRMVDCQTELGKIAKILIDANFLEVDKDGYFRRSAWLRE